jgi:hypothetical protein
VNGLEWEMLMLRKEHGRADGPLRGRIHFRFQIFEAGATVVPSSTTGIILAHVLHIIINHDPCRGSSIGRACGSYNSKEINLKVVGSSPTFGYSYNKAHQSSCPFAFWLSVDCLRSPDQDNGLLALLARPDKRAVTADRY